MKELLQMELNALGDSQSDTLHAKVEMKIQEKTLIETPTLSYNEEYLE
jgi:hypothetical protein